MPPPLPVERSLLIVLLLRRHGPVLFMAPPPPQVFPVNVLPLTVSEPSLRIPPPLSSAVLLEIVQSVTVSVPELKIPAP